jgi:hypothetical protein
MDWKEIPEKGEKEKPSLLGIYILLERKIVWVIPAK